MKKIVIIGPESTGKTTLTHQLADYFQCPMVMEFARGYIDQLQGQYTQEDLLKIAKGQLANEDRIEQSKAPYLFCDTDLRVIRIWSLIKYQKVHPWIDQQISERSYHAYLLMDIDLPWEPDPQREHPKQRHLLFEYYKKELQSVEVPVYLVSGENEKRLNNAIDFVRGLA